MAFGLRFKAMHCLKIQDRKFLGTRDACPDANIASNRRSSCAGPSTAHLLNGRENCANDRFGTGCPPPPQGPVQPELAWRSSARSGRSIFLLCGVTVHVKPHGNLSLAKEPEQLGFQPEIPIPAKQVQAHGQSQRTFFEYGSPCLQIFG